FWTDMRDFATAQGRTTQQGEEGFFGDPITGSSSGPVVAATPSLTAGTVAKHGHSRDPDSFYSRLANAFNIIIFRFNKKNDNLSTSTSSQNAGLFADPGVGWRLGWPDDELDA